MYYANEHLRNLDIRYQLFKNCSDESSDEYRQCRRSVLYECDYIHKKYFGNCSFPKIRQFEENESWDISEIVEEIKSIVDSNKEKFQNELNYFYRLVPRLKVMDTFELVGNDRRIISELSSNQNYGINGLDSGKYYWGDEVSDLEKHLTLFKNYFYGSWSVYMREIGYRYLSNYFRLCFQILKLIDEHEGLFEKPNSDDLKKRYAKIFRAGLSEAELHALLLHGTSIWGKRRLKFLLEKYTIFAHLDGSLGDIETEHTERRNRTNIFDYAHFYNPVAFGNNEDWQEYFALKRRNEYGNWQNVYGVDQYAINVFLKKLPEEGNLKLHRIS